MKKNIKSQRQLRIAEQLKHLISEIITLGNFQNKKIRTIPITVTEVNISPDLKKANIFVISRHSNKSFIKYLNDENFIFKKRIAEKLKLRFVPQLNFRLDSTFEYANKIEKILKEPKVQKDL